MSRASPFSKQLNKFKSRCRFQSPLRPRSRTKHFPFLIVHCMYSDPFIFEQHLGFSQIHSRHSITHGRASVLSGWSACLDRKRHSDEESRGEISIKALKIWKEIRLF